MFKNVASKVAWVGRTASMVFGLALVLALVFGALSVALAHTGSAGLLHLNHNNVASALTTLTANVNGSAMKVVNNNAGTDDSALELSVQSGEAPLKVNSARKVTNLNADKLDGLSSSAFDTSNTGKIHRIDTVTRLDGGETSLLKVGPFDFVGECISFSASDKRVRTWIRVSAEGKPHYGGVISTDDVGGGGSWGNSTGVILPMQSTGSDASDYATGYIYSPGNNPGTVEKGVTFHLYQNRNTHPTAGERCTFGGYVVEEA